MRAMFVVATPGVPMVDAGAEAIPPLPPPSTW